MAIYHQTTKMVKRSEGRNAVAAAAYRAGISLTEEATGITHDYSKKMGVEHSEILAPEGAAEWVFDRQQLWNTVEAFEERKDSQVAREVEIGLPIELSKAEQIELLRDFVKREFVSRGMVADFSLHLDNPENPHAHILLTTRDLTADGFGQKNRGWNQTSELLCWRRGWAEVTNEHLAQAGLGIRIDHRSYAEQQLGLIPGRKIGLGLDRQHEHDLPSFLSDRVVEQSRIMGANGQQIIAEPTIALKALTHGQATFTHHDIARFLHTRTDGAEQFQAAYLKVTTSPELLGLGVDDQGRQRFTTRDMWGHEHSMLADAEQLALRAGHGVSSRRQAAVLSNNRLSDEQRHAFEHVTGAGDLKSLVGVAGSGKSTALAAMREAWEAQGLSVKGAALSGIAAENLQVASGIQSRTLASYELAWNGGRDPLTKNDVLVIDEAGMVGTRQLARVLEVAAKHHAKVVLVGDPEQLQAIEAGAPFRGIAAAHGVAELTQVRRQRQAWQREATAALSSGRTPEALAAYQEKHAIVAVEQRGDARNALLARWARDAKLEPTSSQLVLAYTRDDVQALNSAVRRLRQQTGQLGQGHVITTAHGEKEFAAHDRIRFGRNEKTLGVKNGSLGTVERIEGGVLQVKLDGPGDTRVAVDTKFYPYLDHGYAATVHKAQGTTVDRTYVLATPHFDRHTTYVAMSRHREAATVFYATDDFGGRGGRLDADQIQARFVERLSRVQAKDLAHDYLQRPEAPREELVAAPAALDAGVVEKPKPTLEEIRAAAREQWLKERELAKENRQAPTLEEIRRQGREDWLTQRAARAREAPSAKTVRERERFASPSARELWAQHYRVNPPPVAQLVDQDPTVVGARQTVETHQLNAAQALEAVGQATLEGERWRQAHAMQAKLHDLGVKAAAYLEKRQAQVTAAKRLRAEALNALTPAMAQLDQARSEAERRITHETAPARAQAAELRELARAADERERIVQEFDQLARDRKAMRMGFQDESKDWQATPKALREAIDRYNREPPEVQSGIRQELAIRSDKARVIEQGIRVRREHVRDLGPDLSL
jgi:Ti-type conjugative transfer relaxase TraA